MSLWTDPAGPSRRHASSLRPRADQRSRRGLVVVALVVALVVGVCAWCLGRGEREARGFGQSHAAAGMSCASCHADSVPARACDSCHAGHTSTRGGHRRARAQGMLRCVDCHRIHEDFGGVAFSGGAATRFGPGGATELALHVPRVSAVVPVVPVAACARCHAPSAPGDPIARCLDGTGSMTLCFDEHQAVTGATLAQGTPQERMVLWTLAKEAVAAAPTAPPAKPPDVNLLWGVVALAGFVGTAAVMGLRAWPLPRRARHRASIDVRPPERLRLPQVDASTCLGCSACIDACPYDVLTLEDFVAKVARPQDCCGLTTCQERCPNGSLVVHDGAPIEDRPGVAPSLESTDVPGLYMAGDLTGMPLIRNAINQGAVAVRSAKASGRRGAAEDLDLLVVGAGPAGLSAALQAKQEGLRYAVVEQGELAQSIQSFPRGKLVFDQPLSVPLIGDLWLAESTKEDLLRHWTRIARAEALPIHTQHRVTQVIAESGRFAVTCARGDEGVAHFRAASVVLAIGRRGTPRTLPVDVPPRMQGHVFYSLADARSFAQQRCVVVGLGDVAMEAALALSYAPGTTVTVVARGDDFRRGKARNIAAMRAAEAAGRLQIRWLSAVAAVEEGAVVLQSPHGEQRVGADAVFVMIGAIAPWDFLGSIGVRRARREENPASEDPAMHSRVEASHAGGARRRPEGIA